MKVNVSNKMQQNHLTHSVYSEKRQTHKYFIEMNSTAFDDPLKMYRIFEMPYGVFDYGCQR